MQELVLLVLSPGPVLSCHVGPVQSWRRVGSVECIVGRGCKGLGIYGYLQGVGEKKSEFLTKLALQWRVKVIKKDSKYLHSCKLVPQKQSIMFF